MTVVPFPSSAIKARVVSPSASAFVLSRVPSLVHIDRPLELGLVVGRLGNGADAAESMASWLSTHAVLQITFEVPGQPHGEVSVLVRARPSGSRWIARALVHPAAWAYAASITVVSLSFAGRPLPCDCLPATLRVGYNHAQSPAGAVFAAATAGDLPALHAALEAGGSTEETDEVGGEMEEGRACMTPAQPHPHPHTPHTPGSASSAAVRLHSLFLGRSQRSHRGPPHTFGSRRQPGRS